MSSSVQFDADLWNISGESVHRRGAEGAEDGARFAPPLRPPHAARRRGEVAQLSADDIEWRWGAHVREKAVYYTFVSL